MSFLPSLDWNAVLGNTPPDTGWTGNPTIQQPNQTISTDASNSYEDKLYSNPQTFSFTDVEACIVLPFNPGGGIPMNIPLPGLTLISLSSHRDVYPVVSLGRSGIKGYATGHVTWAGTMGFTVMTENPFAAVIRAYAIWKGDPTASYWISPDELPPFDLNLTFSNDQGSQSAISVKAVKILDSSRTISVRDIQFNEVYSFMAANITSLMKFQGRKMAVQSQTSIFTPTTVNPFMNRQTAKADIIATLQNNLALTLNAPTPLVLTDQHLGVVLSAPAIKTFNPIVTTGIGYTYEAPPPSSLGNSLSSRFFTPLSAQF